MERIKYGKTEPEKIGKLSIFSAKLVPEVVLETNAGALKVNSKVEILVADRTQSQFIPLVNSDLILTPEEQMLVMNKAMDLFEQIRKASK